MFDIIAVGSATVDVFVNTEYNKLIRNKKTTLQAYPVGGKLLIEHLHFTSGGGGTNTAVAFKKLGLKTAFLGKLGNDLNADLVSHDLQEQGITNLSARGSNEDTGFSIILDSIGHDRTILTKKGANNTLKIQNIKLKKLKTKWMYFSTMMQDSYQTLKTIANFAKKNNIKIAMNISQYLAEKGIPYLKPILKNVAIFILNKEEALTLTKQKTVKNAYKKLHNLGIPILSITDGKNGASASDGKNIYTIKPHKVKVVETTGAGDAFASSFVTGYINKQDITFALQAGKANAESVIQHHGAKNKLLTWKEINSIIKKKPGSIKKT